jgi:hypothetical protein
VEKNESMAKMWYAEAKNSDPKKAAEILRRLRIQM